MNDETQTEELPETPQPKLEIPLPLPEPTRGETERTFPVPNILISKVNGITSIREGGDRQIKSVVTKSFSFEALEKEQPFVIKAHNTINFGDARITVLNDAMDGLQPSSPSASEYLALVGTEVLTFFRCAQIPLLSERYGKPVFETIRSTIILP